MRAVVAGETIADDSTREVLVVGRRLCCDFRPFPPVGALSDRMVDEYVPDVSWGNLIGTVAVYFMSRR